MISSPESGDESSAAIELVEVRTSDSRLNEDQEEQSQDSGDESETGTVNSGFCREESTWGRTHQEDVCDGGTESQNDSEEEESLARMINKILSIEEIKN